MAVVAQVAAELAWGVMVAEQAVDMVGLMVAAGGNRIFHPPANQTHGAGSTPSICDPLH